MKILHTSDWHIGKKIDGCDLLKEQRTAINEIAEIADRNQASVIAVCGDVLERGAGGAAEETLVNGLIALSGGGQRLVLVIAGKSDDTETLNVLKTALGGYNIIIVTDAGEKILPPTTANSFIKITGGKGSILLSLRDEKTNIAFLPYTGAAGISAYDVDNAVKNFDKADANVIMAYVDADAGIDETLLSAEANYIALGGSHKTQSVDNDRNVYYSGSILPDSFEDFKSKDKNQKKVIVADVSPLDVTKTVEKLTKSKSLVRVSSSSVEQALSKLRGLTNGLVELDINLSHPLSISEYNAIRNSNPDIVRINLNIPEQLGQNKIGILKSGDGITAFKNFYSCVFDSPPSKELVGLFGQIANTEYSIDGSASLKAADIKNILTLDKKARARYIASVFNAEEYQKNIVRDILEFQEGIKNQNDKEIANIEVELGRYSDIDAEISMLEQKKQRTLEAKRIMPLFEKTIEYGKEAQGIREKLADLQSDRDRLFEQSSIYDIEPPRAEYEQAAEELAAKKAEINANNHDAFLNEEHDLRERLEVLAREVSESYENLRHYENEIVDCERTTAEQAKILESQIPQETAEVLSKAVICEEILKIYSAENIATENKIKGSAGLCEESEKKLAVLVAKRKELLEQIRIFEKNIFELSGETEVNNVLQRLEDKYKNGRELLDSIKEINIAIKEQIAENDAASENIRGIISQIDEASRLKIRQIEQIAEYEEQLEKFNREKTEQLGVNIFAKIGNAAGINEPCPLCKEIIKNKPNFQEASTTEFDREIDDIKERLKDAYSRRDILTAELLLKERLREESKNKLAGIVDELKRLKLMKHNLMLSSGAQNDERAVAESALLLGQRVLKVKNELRTLEALRVRLSEVEREVAAESGNLNFYKKNEEALKNRQEEISGRVADVSLNYFQIKEAVGDDLKKLEQELQTQNKRREDALQNILAEENRKMLLLSKLRTCERTVCEAEVKQMALEERLKDINRLKSAQANDDTEPKAELAELIERLNIKRENLRKAEEGLYTAAAAVGLIEREINELAAKSERIDALLNECKADSINAMLSGGFKNADELRVALADETSLKNALKILEQTKAKIIKLSMERERLLMPDEQTEHTLALTKTLYDLFCSNKLIDLVAEEYSLEKARQASKKLNELSGGRYAISYEDGFVTRDNFAAGAKKRIVELSGEIEKAFLEA
jgi:exonuclease SbcD